MGELRVGVLTCSDSRAAGKADDISGRALIGLVEERDWTVVAYHVCPDDQECIRSSLMEMVDVDDADVVLTIGGTGVGPRDVTPEATLAVCERAVPGLAEAIRAEAIRTRPTAMLSRNAAAMRDSTLIVNLPGAPETIPATFASVADRFEEAVRVAGRTSAPATAGDGI